jgi:hypothetical protein
MTRRPIRRALAVACGLAAVAAGCGGQSNGGGGTDTNTNWLKQCDADGECGAGLACLCGLCTRACDADRECAGQQAAACTPGAVGCAGGARICLAQLGMTGSGGTESAGPALGPGGFPLGETDKDDSPSACGRPRNDYFSLVDGCSALSVTCLPPSEAFTDDCGCGCTAVDAYPRICRDQCALGDECEQHSVEAFPSIGETEAYWVALCPISGAYEGRCSDGQRFFFYSNGFTGEVRHYDATGERFLGVGTFTDDLERTCGGQGYWPEPVLCDTPTVVRVFCGSRPVGDVFTDLPWADGRPGDLPI